MNKQNPPHGIEWTRRRLPDGSQLPGFTWNVVGGCAARCRWQMPDDSIAICYAESTAEGLAQAVYPWGFGHHYFHPERLEEPLRLKQPAGIFLDSMSDLMGGWVPEWEVNQVLDVCWQTPQHTYFLLTKNPPRLRLFDFPPNVWVGVSSPPDWMFGQRLTRHKQERWLHRALEELELTVPSPLIRWASFEPLSWDVSPIVADHPHALDWAVIGAASNGRKKYQPEPKDVRRLLEMLDTQNVPVFFKGNLLGNPAAKPWREEFPR